MANLTRTQLIAEINARVFENTEGLVTANAMAGLLTDFAASTFNLLSDAGTVGGGLSEYVASTLYPQYQGVLYTGKLYQVTNPGGLTGAFDPAKVQQISSDLKIGDGVISGTSKSILFIDGSTQLAQSTALQWDYSTNTLILGSKVKLNSLSYSFPASQSANGFLTTDGSGNLLWSQINPFVLGSVLTGFSATNSAVVATDTVLQAFNKLQGQVSNLGTNYVPLAGGTMTGLLILSGDPTNANGAATKNYVDMLVNGLSWKTSVTYATTVNITLSGEQTIDGVLTNISRVLVKNQTDPTQNGLYLSGPGAWARTSDAATGIEIISATVYVRSGSTMLQRQYTCNNMSAITIGTTAITFVLIAGAGTYTNGTYLKLTGNVFDIDFTTFSSTQITEGTNLYFTTSRARVSIAGTTNRIAYNSTTGVVDIDAAYAGQSSITTLGTITTGTLGSGTKILLGSDATGDIYYNSGVGVLARLADIATGNVLLSGGVGGAPSYGKVSLTAAVTGILPPANGGTGVTSAFTTGSVIFAGAAGAYSQDNVNFFYGSGMLGIGTNVPLANLHVLTTSTGFPRGGIFDQVSTDNASSRFFMRKARGAVGALTTIVNGDLISTFSSDAYDGTNYVDAAKIIVTSSGAVSTGVVPTIMQFQTMTAAGALATALTIDATQHFGIGTIAPTALMHLAAGSATAGTSPLKLTSGTLLTTAEAGSIEFLTDKLYATITTGAARKELVLADSGLTLTHIPYTTTNGRLQGSANMTYDSTNVIFALGGALSFTPGTTNAVPMTSAGSANTFLQTILQNKSNGTNASTDLVGTADTGTDSTNYWDLGVNGSGNTANVWGGALDVYLYASDGALGIGTAAAKPLNLYTGGGAAANIRMTISATGAAVFNGSLAIGNGGVILKTLVASASLTFGSTGSGSATDVTMTVPGAAVDDVVCVGSPAFATTPSSTFGKGTFYGWVSAANTVTIRYQNPADLTARTPGTGTFKVIIFQQ